MFISILLLKKILSMFVALAVGYIIVKSKLLKSEDSKTLSKILAFIGSPCAIFLSFMVDFTLDVGMGILIAAIVAVLLHICYIVLAQIFAKVLRLKKIEQAGIIYSNAGYLTIPLVYAVLGAEMVVYTCAYSVVQTILIWTHAKTLVADQLIVDDGAKKKEVLKIFCNPNFIAIYLGIAAMIVGIRPPEIIEVAAQDFAGLLAPLSMLVVGMLMAKVKLVDLARESKIYLVCVIRLIVIPLFSIGVIYLTSVVIESLGMRYSNMSEIFMVVLWAAAGPVANAITQLSQIYGGDEEYAGKMTMMSLVLCVVTMPLMTMLCMNIL